MQGVGFPTIQHPASGATVKSLAHQIVQDGDGNLVIAAVALAASGSTKPLQSLILSQATDCRGNRQKEDVPHLQRVLSSSSIPAVLVKRVVDWHKELRPLLSVRDR